MFLADHNLVFPCREVFEDVLNKHEVRVTREDLDVFLVGVRKLKFESQPETFKLIMSDWDILNLNISKSSHKTKTVSSLRVHGKVESVGRDHGDVVILRSNVVVALVVLMANELVVL